MPENEKKAKLRKVAKGLGFGALSVFAAIGLVATIACLARCGEQPKQEASAEDVSLPYVRQPRKEAPQFSEDANVFKGDNGRVYADSYYFYNQSSARINFYNDYHFSVFEGRVIKSGLYYLVINSVSHGTENEQILFGNSLLSDVMSVGFVSYGSASVNSETMALTYINTTHRFARYVYVSPDQVDAGYYVYSRLSVADGELPRMYAVDMMEASPSDKVILPEGWKPYNLMDCEPKQNGWGVCNARTTASLSPLGYGMLDGLLFRSNGKLYNRISIIPWSPYLDNSTAHTFGYYDASGKLVWKTLEGDYNDLILQRIVFDMVYTDLPNIINAPTAVTTDVVAYCAETSVIVEQQARVVYLSAGPLTWNSPLFRELDVLDVYDEQVMPTDTLMARSPLEWLRLSLADVNPSAPTTDVGIQDGMTLVSDGIVAFMPMLGIEVLPSISLGLLLILPLIGGIIVLIVKVFSK